ncbi:MAG: hypothetical protein JNJ63_13465 [Hyphomonadaceae bacterium]|nr:hypothetical protein [Hyphomonadaceae bacterium]
MTDKKQTQTVTAEALLQHALQGGPQAALAARRAAAMAEVRDPALAQQALALAARLEPLDPAPQLALARLAAEQGDPATARAHAETVLREAVDEAARARAAFMLGELDRLARSYDTARAHYAAVLRIEDALLAADRGNATAARWYARARGRIAELDANAGEMLRARTGAEGALSLLRAVAAAQRESPVLAADIADAEMRLGALELDAGEPVSARRRLGEAIGRYEALAVTEKHEPHWRAVLADAWALAAEAEYARGSAERAREAMDRALQARVQLAKSDPNEAWALAGAWRVRAALLEAIGDARGCADSLVQARHLAEQLCARAPQAEAMARFLAHTLLDQADAALRANQLALARDAADAARLRAEPFAAAADTHPIWFTDVAASWDRLGEVARLSGAKQQAAEAFARAVELRRMAAERSRDTHFARGLAAALVRHGEAALDADAARTAFASFQESTQIRMKFFEAAPADPRTAEALAVALERLGLAALALGDAPSARAAWEDERALAARIFADPDTIDALRFVAIVDAHLASAGGPDAEAHRTASLKGFDALAQAGVLTEREAALRKSLWRV